MGRLTPDKFKRRPAEKPQLQTPIERNMEKDIHKDPAFQQLERAKNAKREARRRKQSKSV